MSTFDEMQMKRARRLARQEINRQQLREIEDLLHQLDPTAQVLSETVSIPQEGQRMRQKTTFYVAFQGQRRRMTGYGETLHEARKDALTNGIQLRLLQIEEAAERAAREG